LSRSDLKIWVVGGEGPVGANVALGPTKRTKLLLTNTFRLRVALRREKMEERKEKQRRKKEKKGNRKG